VEEPGRPDKAGRYRPSCRWQYRIERGRVTAATELPMGPMEAHGHDPFGARALIPEPIGRAYVRTARCRESGAHATLVAPDPVGNRADRVDRRMQRRRPVESRDDA